MVLMITDSGLGGLSVCAGLEQALQHSGTGSGIELLYVNATPHDRIGYNALKTQSERITLFNRFLSSVYKRYQPTEIAIACNTLSVIYDATEFASQTLVPVTGIVETGVELCNTSISAHPDHDLIIFATETTTEADTYPRLIHAPQARMVAQPCPELAHAISNDATGNDCRNLLTGYLEDALNRFDHKPLAVHAFLGCTHYGYQSKIFSDLIEEQGISANILNPNDPMIKSLSTRINYSVDNSSPLSVRFISRYTVPQGEIDSMQSYLNDSAPLTLAALNDQEVHPDLF